MDYTIAGPGTIVMKEAALGLHDTSAGPGTIVMKEAALGLAADAELVSI